MSEDELFAMVALLLIAGHETTVNLIGNGTLALLENPDQLDMLRSDPALIKPAVEELLRFTRPLETATERFAREDTTVAGSRFRVASWFLQHLFLPTATNSSFMTRTDSTSVGSRIRMWHSAKEYTTALVHPLLGWKGRSLLLPCFEGRQI